MQNGWRDESPTSGWGPGSGVRQASLTGPLPVAYPHLQPLHFLVRDYFRATNALPPALMGGAHKHQWPLPLGQHNFEEHVPRLPELPRGAERHLLVVVTS